MRKRTLKTGNETKLTERRSFVFDKRCCELRNNYWRRVKEIHAVPWGKSTKSSNTVWCSTYCHSCTFGSVWYLDKILCKHAPFWYEPPKRTPGDSSQPTCGPKQKFRQTTPTRPHRVPGTHDSKINEIIECLHLCTTDVASSKLHTIRVWGCLITLDWGFLSCLRIKDVAGTWGNCTCQDKNLHICSFWKESKIECQLSLLSHELARAPTEFQLTHPFSNWVRFLFLQLRSQWMTHCWNGTLCHVIYC